MRRYMWLILLVGIVAAQAGHLLAYQLLFGSAAQQAQSSGAHAYFPTLVKTALGAAAAAGLAALFVVGLLGARRHEEGQETRLGPVRTAVTRTR